MYDIYTIFFYFEEKKYTYICCCVSARTRARAHVWLRKSALYMSRGTKDRKVAHKSSELLSRIQVERVTHRSHVRYRILYAI